MDDIDRFDIGLRMLPRKIAKGVVLALVVLSSGHFITWYAQEKAESVQRMAEEMFEGLLANLPTPTVAPTTVPTTP